MSESTDLLKAFQPRPTSLTAPFWQGAKEGRLVLTRCVECRGWQHPPLETCRTCGGVLRPEDAPLNGVIYSSTVMHHRAVPLYDAPYLVAVVEVGGEGGPRFVARVVDSDFDAAGPGAAVSIGVSDLPGGSFKVPTVSVVSGEVNP